MLPGGQIAEGNIFFSSLDYLLPAFVKHLFLLLISHQMIWLQAELSVFILLDLLVLLLPGCPFTVSIGLAARITAACA